MGATVTKPPDDMTIRDQFAFAALTGFCSQVRWVPPEELLNKISKDLAQYAYVVADAMLAERAKSAE
jgi:hypothetical protein